MLKLDSKSGNVEDDVTAFSRILDESTTFDEHRNKPGCGSRRMSRLFSMNFSCLSRTPYFLIDISNVFSCHGIALWYTTVNFAWGSFIMSRDLSQGVHGYYSSPSLEKETGEVFLPSYRDLRYFLRPMFVKHSNRSFIHARFTFSPWMGFSSMAPSSSSHWCTWRQGGGHLDFSLFSCVTAP